MSSSLLTSVLAGLIMAGIVGVAALIVSGSPGSIPSQGITLARAAGDSEPIYVKVEAGDNAGTIGGRLKSAGVIDSASSFELLARITGSERRLAAGEYEFLPGTSTLDTVTRIRDGLTASRIVTIPEGLRLEEVAAILDRRGVANAADFLVAANTIATTGSGIDADLLASRPRSASLEGYAYPATYSFGRSVTPTEAVLTMLESLSERLTPELREQARQQGLTVHQVLTLASIVEREAVLPEELPLIASVYRNRLAADMMLQADPTVQYAVTSRPGSIEASGYWKRELTLQDLGFDSTYNTYVKKGLPPGPIANPGIQAIEAVIKPAPTSYLFFVARNDGSHAFSTTFEEHQRLVQQFQP